MGIRQWFKKRNPKPSLADRTDTPVGTIECYCGEQLPVFIDIELSGEPGNQRIEAKIDNAALWLHSFTKHPNAYQEG